MIAKSSFENADIPPSYNIVSKGAFRPIKRTHSENKSLMLIQQLDQRRTAS